MELGLMVFLKSADFRMRLTGLNLDLVLSASRRVWAASTDFTMHLALLSVPLHACVGQQILRLGSSWSSSTPVWGLHVDSRLRPHRTVAPRRHGSNQSLGLASGVWGLWIPHHDSCSATNRGSRRVRARRSGMRRGWDDLWGEWDRRRRRRRRSRLRSPAFPESDAGCVTNPSPCRRCYRPFRIAFCHVNICAFLRLRKSGPCAVHCAILQFCIHWCDS